MTTTTHRGDWTATATAAALMAVWLAVPGCRRVEAPKDEKSASQPDQAVPQGTMRPALVRPVVPPKARPSSRRAKIPPKKKVGFKLAKSDSWPPKPVPGCSKCGTKVPGRGVISGEGKLLGYTIRIYVEFGGVETFSIVRGSKRLFDSSFGGHLFIGGSWGTSEHTDAALKRLYGLPMAKRKAAENEISDLRRVKRAARWITPGADFTGDGRPNLVVGEYSGGGHCCTSLVILELEPRVRKLQKIDIGNTWGFERNLVDLDRDGYPEVEFRDWNFAYWMDRGGQEGEGGGDAVAG